LPDSNSRIFFARPILPGLAEYILDLIFPHLVVVNIWQMSFFINVKTNFSSIIPKEIKICFINADKPKIVNYVSASAIAQHVETQI
jgi:hypothetical protein